MHATVVKKDRQRNLPASAWTTFSEWPLIGSLCVDGAVVGEGERKMARSQLGLSTGVSPEIITVYYYETLEMVTPMHHALRSQ